MSKFRLLSWSDRIGTATSLVCAIHCILLPLLVTVLPLVGLSFLGSATFETTMIVATTILATVSSCWGYRIHGSKRIVLGFAISVFLIGLAPLVFSHNREWILMSLGGLFLAVTHIMNSRMCNKCSSCGD